MYTLVLVLYIYIFILVYFVTDVMLQCTSCINKKFNRHSIRNFHHYFVLYIYIYIYVFFKATNNCTLSAWQLYFSTELDFHLIPLLRKYLSTGININVLGHQLYEPP